MTKIFFTLLVSLMTLGLSAQNYVDSHDANAANLYGGDEPTVRHRIINCTLNQSTVYIDITIADSGITSKVAWGSISQANFNWIQFSASAYNYPDCPIEYEVYGLLVYSPGYVYPGPFGRGISPGNDTKYSTCEYYRLTGTSQQNNDY